MIDVFTSTGKKLLKHPAILKSWIAGRAAPQSLQVALTEKCNLSCSFCSVRNREWKYEFDFDELCQATSAFIQKGVKTVEITGGGEPLLYPWIGEYIGYLRQRCVKVGLITNGLGIDKAKWVDSLEWIRISANVFDYKGRIDLPVKFKGTLGFSYVWGNDSSIQTLERIKKIAIKNGVKYIRLVNDCLAEFEEIGWIASTMGPPVFFQRKEFRRPDKCYWGYLKPFLYPDSWVYPCSSIVLNPDADKQFHESYRICHWKEIDEAWSKPIHSLVDTSKCSKCVFANQNDTLAYCLTPQQHEDFI